MSVCRLEIKSYFLEIKTGHHKPNNMYKYEYYLHFIIDNLHATHGQIMG